MEILKKVFGKKNKFIKIGRNKLYLNLANPHEKGYYKSIENEDFFIAKYFIKENYVVLDLGANIGFTTLLYLKFGASRVYAFEPVPELSERIRNIGDDRIEVSTLAVSDRIGENELVLSSSHNQGHSLNEEWPLRFQSVFTKTKKIKVETTTLDNYFKNDFFDFIKIDVEGLEENVLKGGASFFERNKGSIIQIEIYDWQFDKTHCALKKYYEYSYLPIFDNEMNMRLIEINSLRDKNNQIIKGAPNYIYSNVKF